MSVIKVSCIDQVMTLTNTPVIASGGVNENYIEFSFCSLWDGFAKVCAFYQQPGTYYHSLLDSSDRCVIPAEVCAESGPMYFGVVGVKDDVTRTSEVVKYKLVEGVMTEITDPTEDIYQQILAELAAIRELVAGIGTLDNIVTVQQFQEHTNDKDNPHGVTAEQVGAAPAEHTHTPDQVGAAPAGHTHTPDQIGAAPAEHTHTPDQVGAAPAEHTHTPASIGAATVATFTTTAAPSDWSGSAAPFVVDIAVSGVLASDSPIVDLMPSDDYATAEQQIEAWGYVYRAVTSVDTLTLYATEMPAVALPIQIKVVR